MDGRWSQVVIWYDSAMAELKTKPTSQNPTHFLNTVEPEEKRRDSLVLLELFKKMTGEKGRMWGTSIVGFGMYHYKSERSTQEGDWPLVAFSPRKQNLTLYILSSLNDKEQWLKKLGKHKASGGCLHINRLSDVDKVVLAGMIKESFLSMKKKYA